MLTKLQAYKLVYDYEENAYKKVSPQALSGRMEELLARLTEAVSQLIPRLGGAAAALLIGWTLGRLAGSAASRLARRLGLDELTVDSPMARVLKSYGISASGLIGAIIRWSVYAASILVAIDLLGVPALEAFSEVAIEYLPSLIGGMLVLVGGIALAEFLARMLGEAISGLPHSRLIVLFARFVLLTMVITMSLMVMKVDATILYSMLNAIFWGISICVGAAVGIALGFSLKDYVATSLKAWAETAKKVERELEVREYEERIRGYEKRVEELCEELKRREERIRELEERSGRKLCEYERVEADVRAKLEDLVGDTGEIVYAKGGYRILISDITRFPLAEVLVCLTNNGYRAVVGKGEKGYIINARPVRQQPPSGAHLERV